MLLTDAQQEYLTVPLLSHPLQHPLSWLPDDPSLFPDLPFYPGEPLHAVMSATDDRNVFSLTDFDDLFDGTRELEILMGPNMMPSSLLDMCHEPVHGVHQQPLLRPRRRSFPVLV